MGATCKLFCYAALRAGFEPATIRLTAGAIDSCLRHQEGQLLDNFALMHLAARSIAKAIWMAADYEDPEKIFEHTRFLALKELKQRVDRLQFKSAGASEAQAQAPQ